MNERIKKLEDFADQARYEFGELRAELRSMDARLTARLDQTATKADVEAVRTEIQKSVSETHKWMIGTVIGLFIGFGGLFLAMSNALKPSPQVAQWPPIIITTPQPSTVISPPPAKP
jgi:hypothetical protein